jgi:hypothetical protein
MERVTVVITLVALVILVIVLAITLNPTVADKAASALLGNNNAPTVPEAAMPVPGFRYYSDTSKNVANLRAMWWTGTPSTDTHPRYENPVGENDMASMFTSSWLWGTPPDNGALQWLASSSLVSTNYSAYCPLGSVVTGVKTFGGNTNAALASAVVPMCKSIFNMSTDPQNPADGAVEGILVADSDPTTHIDTSTMPAGGTYYGTLGWMTANNFLNGDTNQWFGNLLVDQLSHGANDTPPTFFWEGITMSSRECDQGAISGIGANPWKPSNQNNGDGGNKAYFFQFTILYYQTLDLEGSAPREFQVQLPNYQWSGSVTDSKRHKWTYTNTQKPFVPDKVVFDATRPITMYGDGGINKPLNYGGSNVEMMGMAIKPGSLSLMDGSPNEPNGECGASIGNCVGPTPGTGGLYCRSQNVPLEFGLESQVNNQYFLNFCFGCSVMRVVIQLDAGPVFPTNHMLSLDTLPNGLGILSNIQQWSKDTHLKVMDPVCTNVMMATDDSGNPVNLTNLNNLADETTENACALRAKAQCAALPKDDPFCACINAQPIAGVDKALGKPFSMHCLSNGDCMKASPLETWMDFDTADVTLCPTLKIEICEFLAKLDATAIVITNTRFKCSNISNSCPECNAGGGPCKAVEKIGGLVACRPKQKDGTCGDGFVECSEDGDDTGLTRDEVLYIAGGFIALIIILAFGTYVYRARQLK